MNADRIARFYRWIEYAAFGRSLERCRFACLTRLRHTRRILIFGEGDGRFVSRLLESNAAISADVFEASPKMIELARSRLPHGSLGRVTFHCGDARAAALEPASYDAAVTQFFLDCFDEPGVTAIAAKVRVALKPGGLWQVCEFRLPTHGVARWHARLWLDVMYLFFRITTGLTTSRLPPHERLMEAAGFDRIAEQTWRAGLMTAQLWRKRG